MKYTRQQFREALNSPRMRAFLWIIRNGEGTASAAGYRTLFGGGMFDSFDNHPNRVITKRLGGNPISSTAAGAYQFLHRTWEWIRSLYGFEDFSPRCQDEAAVALIAHRGALDDVLGGNITTAIEKCNREWASLPGSPYGQPTMDMSRAIAIYQNFLHEAPVEERTVPSGTVKEDTMNPFVITAVTEAIKIAPDLVRMFGGKKAEENAALAEKVVEVAQKVTGEINAQAAVERLQDSPEMQAKFREEVYRQRRELQELADQRIQEAREFTKSYRGGKPVLGNFTFPELLSALFAVGGYGLGVAVIFLAELSPELKAAVVGALVVQAVSDVRGFWFGSTVQKDEGEKK